MLLAPTIMEKINEKIPCTRSAIRVNSKIGRPANGQVSFRPCTAVSSNRNKKQCSNPSTSNSNIILPRLSRGIVRPCTSSSTFKNCSPSTTSSHRYKQNQELKQNEKVRIRFNKSINSVDYKVRPSTAPIRHKEFTKHCSYDELENTGFSQISRRESFNKKKEERERRRCEIYAINNVMKQAFHREFDEYMKNKKKASNI